MAVLKCKMCGGDLNIIEGASTAECEFCGSVQTIPKVDDEKKLTLFARANRLRIACEFDKAAGIYESIVADFPEEAEAYWGLVLCKYGIEYVDDPGTVRKIPTCHRSSFESIMEDSDFEQTLENADGMARRVYREEAKQIEELRKGIIAVSAKEEPYDVFICYKETDESGNRTIDSVLAQDVYDALTDKGYRVFFSRITLEDKLGVEYEPYIFAALNSAKIMLAFGTDYEYFNAVWVKNEWSRFLKLMAKDKNKHLIPCYKGIDAYDMPKEFARLQAQDLGKVGATQDLLRGIEKILPRQEKVETAQQTTVVTMNQPSTDNYIKRGMLALEDEDWCNAKRFFEDALNLNAECSEAYFGLAMCDVQVNNLEDLVSANKWEERNYRRGKQFAGDTLLKQLDQLEQAEKLRLQKIQLLRERNRKASGLLDAGAGYIVGVKADKTVVAEGNYKEGQCSVGGWENVVSVAAGTSHTIGLKADGTVVAVGEHRHGCCDVSHWRGIIAVAAGFWDSYGLKKDGTVLHAGHDGLLSHTKDWERIIAISARDCSVAGLKSDGTVLTDGIIEECVSDWKNIIAISVGLQHIVGLKRDGTVVAAGENACGQCEVNDWKDIIAIAAGDEHTVGLKSDGTVMTTIYMGDPDEYCNQCEVEEWEDVIAISAGYDTFALKSDGTVLTTAEERWPELKNDSWKLFQNIDTLEEEHKGAIEKARMARQEEKAAAERIKPYRKRFQKASALLSVGYDHTVGLKMDGTVIATGPNGWGECEVGDWLDITSVAAGDFFTVGLKTDGTVVATEYVGEQEDYHGHCEVSSWQNIVAISASGDHTVGLKRDGTVVATEYLEDDEDDPMVDSPSNVDSWKNIIAISAGSMITIGLKSDGTVLTAGIDWDGRCNVHRWKDIVAIATGHYHTVGLKANGTVVAVGGNDEGQCNIGDWTNIGAICAGSDHTVGLKIDGTVVAVGKNDEGQCNVHEWNNIVAISAGGSHTVGLKADGTLVAVGSNDCEQCDVGNWRLFQQFETLEQERSAAREAARIAQEKKAEEERIARQKREEEERKKREEEEHIARQRREEEARIARQKREEEERIAREKKAEAERIARERRMAGLCQHCGGELKGFFSKKCVSCGKPKDY